MNDINRFQEPTEDNIIVPWEGSGLAVDSGTSAEDIMRMASLDWEVDGRPLYAPQGVGSMRPIPSHKAIIRKDNESVLGVVGSKWEILQNQEIFSFIDDLRETGAVKYHTAGSFKGGKVVWVQAEYAESEIITGDIHKKYLLFVNSFDGTYSVRIGSTDLLMACTNMIVMETRSGMSIRHTLSMKHKLESVKNALIKSKSAGEQFDNLQRALLKLNMTPKLWEDFGHRLVPDPEEGKNKTRSQSARETIMSLSILGRGQEISGVAGTGYAALNALTQYVNYDRMARGKTLSDKQSGRFQSVMFGSGGKMINKGIGILNEYLIDGAIQV